MSAVDSVFDHFELELDAGNDAIFRGGELITGKLKIKLKRPMTIQAIKLQFKGRAAFAGKENQKSGEVEKVYFDKDFTLLERPPGRPEPGHFPWIADFLYNLPFECPLPIGCPTSYESPHAFIRYYVRAVVVEENDTMMTEYMVKKCLSVVMPTKTPMKMVTEPVIATDSLTHGGCCCRNKIAAEARLQKSIYSPGEKIVGTLKINSKHQKKLLELVEVRLTDRVGRVDALKNQFSSQRTLVRRQLDKSEFASSNLTFLQIPSVPPSIPGPTSESILATESKVISPISSKIIESPSTMTLRYRKQPFVRIEYQVQISIGGKLLLEMPISIVSPVVINENDVIYKPFVAGPQPVDESDESNMKQSLKKYEFTPQYAILDESIPQKLEPTAPPKEPDGIVAETLNSDSDKGLITICPDDSVDNVLYPNHDLQDAEGASAEVRET